MASGMADFERMIRPKYGKPQHMPFIGVVHRGETEDFFTIKGKGVIYGGYIHVYGDTSQKDSVVHPYIDDDQYSNRTFEGFLARNLTTVYSAPLYLKEFDEVNYKYTLCFSPGITFEKKIQIRYVEDTGDDAVCLIDLFYALI